VEAGPSLIKEQLRVVFAHFPIRAAKVGALSSEHAVRVVAEGIEPYRGLNERRIRVVMDAGLVNGKGERVVDKKTQAQLTHRLFPLADLICCNLDEVEIFLGTSVSDYQEMKAAAQQLSEAFETGVLVKGGHLKDDNATDVLCHGGGVFRIETPRVGGLRTHGIGATLSAAITANLAHGLGIEEAVNTAKRYVAHLLPHCIEWKCPDEEVQETIQVVDQFAVEMLLGSEEDTAD
jgi:hydroxymethylpyrimidine kinase/phosphomethylpyrimidine kinase